MTLNPFFLVRVGASRELNGGKFNACGCDGSIGEMHTLNLSTTFGGICRRSLFHWVEQDDGPCRSGRRPHRSHLT